MTTMTHAPAVAQDDALALDGFGTLLAAPDARRVVETVGGDRRYLDGVKVTATRSGWRIKGNAALVALAGQDRITQCLRPDVKRVDITEPAGKLADVLRVLLSTKDLSRVRVWVGRTKTALFVEVDASEYGQHGPKATKPARWAPVAGDWMTLAGGELDGGQAQVWCTLADGRTVAVVDDGSQRPVVVYEDGTWRRYESVAGGRWDESMDRESDAGRVHVEVGAPEHEARLVPWRRAAGLPDQPTWVMWLDGGDVIVNGVWLQHQPNGACPYYWGGEDFARARIHGLYLGGWGLRSRVHFSPPADAEVRDAGPYYAAAARTAGGLDAARGHRPGAAAGRDRHDGLRGDVGRVGPAHHAGRHALTRAGWALTVVVITTGALTAGCRTGPPPPSTQYRHEIKTCDALPDVADRSTCWVDAVHRERARRDGRNRP